MEVRKGYKQTEIGVIPIDWEVKTLKDVLTNTQLGGNYNNSDLETEFPLIKMGNLNRGFINIQKLQYITNKSNVSEDDLLKYGDVILNTRNTLELVGKVAIWRNELPIAYFNSNILRLKFNDKFISSNFFMNLVLNQPNSISQLKGIATGTTSVAAIYNRDLIKILVQVPTLKEQTAIANALSDTDAWINSLEQLLTKKRLIKQGAMQELLQPKEGWEVKNIGQICNYQNGTSLEKYFNNKEGYKVISIGNYSPNGIFLENNTFIDKKYKSNVNKFLLNKNELTMILNDKTAVGTIIGRVLFIDKNNEYIFNQRTMRLIPKLNINSKFLYHLINSDLIHNKIVASSKPGTQIYVNTNDILDLELYIPKINEQTRIATILSDMDEEIGQLERKLEKAKQIKQGIMQELLTGRIRLV